GCARGVGGGGGGDFGFGDNAHRGRGRSDRDGGAFEEAAALDRDLCAAGGRARGGRYAGDGRGWGFGPELDRADVAWPRGGGAGVTALVLCGAVFSGIDRGTAGRGGHRGSRPSIVAQRTQERVAFETAAGLEFAVGPVLEVGAGGSDRGSPGAIEREAVVECAVAVDVTREDRVAGGDREAAFEGFGEFDGVDPAAADGPVAALVARDRVVDQRGSADLERAAVVFGGVFRQRAVDDRDRRGPVDGAAALGGVVAQRAGFDQQRAC